MTRQPFAHQDASGMAGAPVAIFVDGEFVERVNQQTDPYGFDAIGRILAKLAPRHVSAEALITCVNHAQQSAADCVICDPMED